MTISSNIPISHTKIIVPRRREEILTRKRLLEMMFEFLDKKLILASAPAGYGKTSLLIDFHHNCDLPFCWLSLDTLDRDPQRFASYFIGSLEEKFPNFGRRTSEILNSITSISDAMESLVVTLVNDIYDHIPQHFVLVLDDYHLIGDIPVIQNFLNRFIQLVDENCHLIISSRTLTQLPNLPLLVARNQVGGLDLSELAFRADEIQSLFVQNYKTFITDDVAKELFDETEGWITGLQLTRLGTFHEERPQVTRAAGVGLFDFLGQQVLDQQPEDIRFFLLRSSLLEEFDVALCKIVFTELYPKRKDWSRWIDVVIKKNLFALPVGDESGWVRYHHLFRDFLQNQMYKEFPGEISPILRKLAQAYEMLNEWDKAYHVQKRLNDVEALAGLIERAAPHLMSHALVTLDTWLKELPPSILITNPGIVSVRGAIEYMKGNLQEGLELFNQAEVSVRKTNNITTLALTLVRRATLNRLLGEYKAALQDANEVLKITEANDQLQTIHANALRQKGLSLLYQGQSRSAVKILEHALEFYVRVEDTSHIPILMMETAIAYDAVGKRNEAKRFYDEALKIWKKEGNLTWQANLLNNLGVLYHLDGEYDKAILTLEEGLLCAKQSSFSARTEALLLISLGDVYTEVEEFDLAQQHYQQGQNLADEIGERLLLIYLYLSQANLSLRQRKLEIANRWLNDASSLISAQAHQYFEDGLWHLLRGQLLLQEKDFDRAIRALEIAETRFKSGETSVEFAKTQLLLAAAYYQEKDQLEVKKRVKNLLRSQDVTKHSFLIFLQHIRDSLYGLQSNAEVGVELRELIRKSQKLYVKMPDIRRHIRRLARTIEIPDAKVTIQAFGRAHVKVGGKTLVVSDWQTQSVRDLFFYFLTVKDPLTKEQIGTVFWPDIEEPSRLKMRFKNDLYRLRRAVGSETILFENDRYSFNRSLDFDYDVDAFESFLSQAKKTKDAKLQIELFQRAVNLVHGHFLEDIDSTWVWPERERLDQVFLQTVLELAELLKKSGRNQEAIGICQRAIEFDATFEEAYLFTMNLQVKMNDRVSAIRLYETYKEMMKRELDLPPSPDMEAFYRHLIR